MSPGYVSDGACDIQALIGVLRGWEKKSADQKWNKKKNEGPREEEIVKERDWENDVGVLEAAGSVCGLIFPEVYSERRHEKEDRIAVSGEDLEEMKRKMEQLEQLMTQQNPSTSNSAQAKTSSLLIEQLQSELKKERMERKAKKERMEQQISQQALLKDHAAQPEMTSELVETLQSELAKERKERESLQAQIQKLKQDQEKKKVNPKATSFVPTQNYVPSAFPLPTTYTPNKSGS
ncbi:hypothetical protein BLNAU_16091 [Blattamonas nauphoetae]|uniref:Uncharacterized protein n=1 Tax=Blattamonas nauphoetae TaxID=2049346 RepID=A0ABQ9XFL8_9EUKA|nr:hypothetical protein BLNAU_16091 [Blattamonas nauphoetae]